MKRMPVNNQRWQRYTFFLPSFFLPTVLLFALWQYATVCAWIAFGVYGALQVTYALIIEWLRHEKALSPSTTFERGSPSASKCVVLVHGFADTPMAWTRQADELAQRGWRVLVPELDLTATAETWLAVILETLREAKQQAAWVELWAHSMGAALSVTAAQTESIHRLVLWAPFFEPYMGRFASRTLYWCHRLLLLWPYTLTWFPIARHGKGDPETFYRVRRVIPTRTFASALAVPKAALRCLPNVPTVVLLSQHDTVVKNAPVLRHFKGARFLFAVNPRSSHALTNAVDWKLNLERILEMKDETCDSL